MTWASISFYAAAVIAVIAGLAAVFVRRSDRALAGFGVCFAALLVPLIQLRAGMVAAAVLLAAVVSVVLLGALVGLGGRPSSPARRLPIAYWLPAALGLLGFVWVVLATGSRQVVEHGPPLAPGARFGSGDAILLELGANFVVPTLLVALLALCAVIAAVLAVVAASERS